MKKYSIIIAILLVCFACSETEQEPIGGNEEFIINAGVSTSVQGGEMSRADPLDPEPFEKNFDLFLTQTKPDDRKFGPELYHAKHATSSYNIHNASNEKLYWDNIGGLAAELEFFGIHPKGVITPTKLDFAIQEDQTSDTDDLDASDLKISNKVTEYTLNKQKGSIEELTFNHLLSKITLILTPKEGFEEEPFDPNLTLLDFNTTCSVNIAGLSINTPNTPKSITPKKVSGENRIKTYTAIIVPGQSIDKDAVFAEIKLEIKGTIHTYKLGMPAAILIEKGKNYLFEVTVNKSTTDIEASLVPWDIIKYENNEVKIGLENVETSIGNTPIEGNSELLIDIDGNRAHYIATGEKPSIKWEYKDHTKKIYWDNIKYKTGLKANAILCFGKSITGINNDPENIYIGESQELRKAYSHVQFKEMTHPFSKIKLTIKSLKEKEDVNLNKERVDLSKITKIQYYRVQEFERVETDLSEDDFLSFYYETNSPEFDFSASEPLVPEEGEDTDYMYYTGKILYIKPGKFFAKGAKLLDITVQETPVEDTNIVNTYPFYIPTEGGITFAANKEYNITITLKKTEIVDMEVSIKGWEETDDINGSGTIDDK